VWFLFGFGYDLDVLVFGVWGSLEGLTPPKDVLGVEEIFTRASSSRLLGGPVKIYSGSRNFLLGGRAKIYLGGSRVAGYSGVE